MTTTTTFLIERGKLDQFHWRHDEPAPVADGAARLRLDLFSLTSNNITYAAFGETMNYWGFFPTGSPTTGCLPVWGFANVIESRCAGVEVGERFYGYFPIASELVVQPVRISPAGFTDGAEHRRELHAVYNNYVRCAADPGYSKDHEAEQALMRPLFTTSFLIDDFLADYGFFGARSVVLSSASSKTAYGTAFCLSQRRGAPDAPRIIGLTSTANVEFTRGLGCYDDVLDYDQIDQLPTDVPTVYVDYSGSAPVRTAVHTRLGNALKYSCAVGGTHWEELGTGKGLPGPRPVLFFAPAQGKKRLADWGQAGWQQRTAEAWAAFMRPVVGGERPWLQVVHGQGEAAVEAVYAALLAGTVNPAEGHVLTLAPRR